MAREERKIVGGKTQPEMFDDGRGKGARLGKIEHPFPPQHGVKKTIPEEPRGRKIHVVDPPSGDLRPLHGRDIVGDGNSRARRQKLQRVHIIKIFDFLNESDHISPGAAPETVKTAGGRKHREGGRFFAVKGAKAVAV